MTDPNVRIEAALAEALISSAPDSTARKVALEKFEGEYHLRFDPAEEKIFEHLSKSQTKDELANGNLKNWITKYGHQFAEAGEHISQAFAP